MKRGYPTLQQFGALDQARAENSATAERAGMQVNYPGKAVVVAIGPSRGVPG
jgi:hypothetical protein